MRSEQQSDALDMTKFTAHQERGAADDSARLVDGAALADGSSLAEGASLDDGAALADGSIDDVVTARGARSLAAVNSVV